MSAGSEAGPAAFLAALEARATRVETPCGDGVMIWRIWGDGEPLVLGHGAQGSWTHWARNIDSLARHRRLIVADLPGHGDSALPETPDHHGISRALATGLREILGDALPVDICGFSFGGVVFSHLAAFHPGVARRLVLVACGGLGTPHGQLDLRRVSGLVGEQRTAALKANLLGLMLHHPESADALAIHQLVPNARKARLARVPSLVLPDRLIAILPEVACPVDAIWGEFDRPHPNPAVQAEALRAAKPAARFEVVTGAGHWVMYERAAGFERALHAILAG